MLKLDQLRLEHGLTEFTASRMPSTHHANNARPSSLVTVTGPATHHPLPCLRNETIARKAPGINQNTLVMMTVRLAWEACARERILDQLTIPPRIAAFRPCCYRPGLLSERFDDYVAHQTDPADEQQGRQGSSTH